MTPELAVLFSLDVSTVAVSEPMASPSAVRRPSSSTPAVSSATVGAAMFVMVGTKLTLMLPSKPRSAMSVLLLCSQSRGGRSGLVRRAGGLLGGAGVLPPGGVEDRPGLVDEEREGSLADLLLLPGGALDGHG